MEPEPKHHHHSKPSFSIDSLLGKAEIEYAEQDIDVEEEFPGQTDLPNLVRPVRPIPRLLNSTAEQEENVTA